MTRQEQRILKMATTEGNRVWISDDQLIVAGGNWYWICGFNKIPWGEFALENSPLPKLIYDVKYQMTEQKEWMQIDGTSFKSMLNKHIKEAKKMGLKCLYGDSLSGYVQARLLLEMIPIIENPSLSISKRLTFIQGKNGFVAIAGHLVKNELYYIIEEQERKFENEKNI